MSFLDSLLREPAERKFYQVIPDEHILDEAYTSGDIEPNKDYFEVRLSEMFLADKRKYWVNFAPLGIVVGEFLYDTTEGPKGHTVPFLVGTQLIKSKEKYVEGQSVEYYNTRIAGPIAYLGDDVGLFVGLFASQVDNLAENLFSFLETIVKTFDVSVISNYLTIARPLLDGLNKLLGIQQVQFRFGMRDVFPHPPKGVHKFREGYLAYINSPQTDPDLINKLWVKEGRLLVGQNKQSAKPLTGYDYCLVRIERIPCEGRLATAIPFINRLWKEIRGELAMGRDERAQMKHVELMYQLATSPDLTEEHRSQLQLAYAANFEAELAKKKAPPKGPTARSERGGVAVGTGIAKTAILVNSSKVFSDKVEDALYAIRDNWEKITPPREKLDSFELTDEELAKQGKTLISSLKGGRPDPKDLANAFAYALTRSA